MKVKDVLQRDPADHPLVNNGQARIADDSERALAGAARASCAHSSAKASTRKASSGSSTPTSRTLAHQPARGVGQRLLRQRQVAPAEDALPPVARHEVPGRRHGAIPRPALPDESGLSSANSTRRDARAEGCLPRPGPCRRERPIRSG